ncbi:MAG: pilin [Luteimonas sp.]
MRGFSLIALIIVAAIIALLASIALPAYHDYVARAQVAEGYSLASDARIAVDVYHAEREGFLIGNEDAGLASPVSIMGRYVTPIDLHENGVIEVEFGNQASSRISGAKLALTMVDEGGSLHWNCSGLDGRYLPPACR